MINIEEIPVKPSACVDAVELTQPYVYRGYADLRTHTFYKLLPP